MTTTTSGTAKVTTPADNQILITREFNAPKHLVWTAYTTPEPGRARKRSGGRTRHQPSNRPFASRNQSSRT